MAKSELKKEKARLAAGIFVLVVIALALVTSSLAWFLTGKETEVHTFDLQTGSAYNLQISSTGEEKWGYSLRFDDERELRPVAGNGLNFFSPVFGQEETAEKSGVYRSAPTGYEAIEEDLLPEYVFPIDFKVQIESDCNLLVEEFFVEMPSGETNTNFETNEYGVSKSALMGALRIAVLEKTEEGYKRCFLWVPDQEVALETDPRSGKYTIGVHSKDEVFESLTLQEGAALEEHTVVEAPQGDPPADAMQGSGVVTTEDGLTVRFGGKREEVTVEGTPFQRINCYFDPSKAGEDNLLATLTGKQEKEFRVVVWLDGNDNECNNVLMGGKIHVGMKLGIDETAVA